MTSDSRLVWNVLWSAPLAASSSVTIRYEGAVPWRVRSPQELEKTISVRSPASRIRAPHTALVIALALQDARRDEDQQLAAFVGSRVLLEQPANQRNPMQAGGALVRGLLAAHEDPADDRRRPVVDLDLGHRAL